MNRRTLVFGLLAIFYVKPGNAAGWTLISKEEFERDSAAPHSRGLVAPTAQSGAPLIEIEQPDETKPIKVRSRFVFASFRKRAQRLIRRPFVPRMDGLQSTSLSE